VLRANSRFGVFAFIGAGAFTFLLTGFIMSLLRSEPFSHVAATAIFGVVIGGIAQICQYAAPNSSSQRKRENPSAY